MFVVVCLLFALVHLSDTHLNPSAVQHGRRRGRRSRQEEGRAREGGGDEEARGRRRGEKGGEREVRGKGE